jgi:hypothetical protein
MKILLISNVHRTPVYFPSNYRTSILAIKRQPKVCQTPFGTNGGNIIILRARLTWASGEGPRGPLWTEKLYVFVAF